MSYNHPILPNRRSTTISVPKYDPSVPNVPTSRLCSLYLVRWTSTVCEPWNYSLAINHYRYEIMSWTKLRAHVHTWTLIQLVLVSICGLQLRAFKLGKREITVVVQVVGFEHVVDEFCEALVLRERACPQRRIRRGYFWQRMHQQRK